MINPKDIELSNFLRRWHGPIETNIEHLPSSCDWLPNPLRDWHELTSQWQTPITRMNHMTPPQEVNPENGLAVFLENQGVRQWAFSVNEPTAVHEGEDVYEMEKITEDLEVFLIHSALYEVAYGATFWRRCDAVPGEQLRHMLAPLARVAFDDSLTSIHLSDHVIAAVDPHMDGRSEWGALPDHWHIQVAATNSNELEYLNQHSGLSWQHSPWQD
ncbi:hypothetical protein [Streptomyces sp. NPDC002187]|uniref:hypothetical protein n=1 Tax=Streptomyces sp. NPDC002187 TaxID=3364637 RepID=UPI0036C9961F